MLGRLGKVRTPTPLPIPTDWGDLGLWQWKQAASPTPKLLSSPWDRSR